MHIIMLRLEPTKRRGSTLMNRFAGLLSLLLLMVRAGLAWDQDMRVTIGSLLVIQTCSFTRHYVLMETVPIAKGEGTGEKPETNALFSRTPIIDTLALFNYCKTERNTIRLYLFVFLLIHEGN